MHKGLKKHILFQCAAIILPAVLFSGCAHFLPSGRLSKEKFQNNTVRITSTVQTPYFYSPWLWKRPQQISGQGIIISENTVLTLASIVRNAKLIELKIGSEPIPTPMKVKAIDIDANLAILEGNLPEQAEPVSISDDTDFTRAAQVNLYWKTSNGIIREGNAVLDRMEIEYNTDSYQAHIMPRAVKSTQPGVGYGAPVFDASGNFYGLARRAGDKYTFNIITCDIINRSFDLKNGVRRQPTAVPGFITAPLLQVYYRKKLGLTEDNGGCLVSKVFGQGSGSQKLKEGDVLLSVCGRKLDAWGRYLHPEYGKISYLHLFSEYFLKDDFPVRVVRNRKVISFSLDLSNINSNKWLTPSNPFSKPTDYIVRGGFVFVPLTQTYLEEWGADFINKAPTELVSVFNNNRYKVKSDTKKEFVLLSRVLSHPSNIGFQDLNNMIIEKINGRSVKSLKQFAEILNSPSGNLVKLQLAPGHIPLWLSKESLKSADDEISARYGIDKLESIR